MRTLIKLGVRYVFPIAVLALVLSTADVDPAGACVACASGPNVGCDEGWHKAWSSDDDAVWAGEAHAACKCCTCTASHGACPEEGLTYEQAVDRVTRAVEDRDVHALAALVHAPGSRVTLNPERSAVQIRSCNRVTVMASQAIPSDMVRSIVTVGLDPTARAR